MPGERRTLDAFVGRDAELAMLTRALDRAVGGPPAGGRGDPARGTEPGADGDGRVVVALAAGEAGIGKSRLVDALATEARRRRLKVVWGEAREGQQGPLSLWTSVERALGIGSDHADGALPGSERRWELVDLLGAELAEAAPVVVVLEDLHWADDSSIWVLERLPRRLLGHGVLLVGTTRREEPGSEALVGVRQLADVVVELGGLEVDAVDRLIDALAADDVPSPTPRADASDLVARTGGNPLFLRELLAMGRRGDRLPPVVSGVLTRSLSRLDEPVQEALAALAVAGHSTPLAVLTAALGTTVDDVMARFEAAAAADVVELGPAGRAGFRHALLREAAVDAVTPGRRRALHAALADSWTVLDTSPTGRARAATHRLAALPHGDPLTAGEEALAAVRRLRAARDEVAAAELATAADRALDACGPAFAPAPGDGTRGQATRGRLVVELAQALYALGEELHAETAFARAADLLRDLDEPELWALAEAGACRRANPFAPLPDKIQRLAAADAALPDGDHRLRVGLLGRMAVLRCALPDNLAAAHADGDAAVAMARRLDDPDLLVTALADRHLVPVGPAGLRARAEAADEIVALGERLRRPDIALQGYEWRFGERLDRAERNSANADLDALEAYAQVMPSPRWRWSALIRRATVHLVDGDLAGALACAREVATLGADVAEPPEILAMEFSIRATAALLWGTPDDGLADLYDRLEDASRPFLGVPFIALMMARGACAVGRQDQVVSTVQRYAADPTPLFSYLEGIALVAELGVMVADMGLAGHAARLRDLLAPYGDRLGAGGGIQLQTPVAATMGRLALLTGDTATAVADGERAVAIAEAMPSPTLVALTTTYLAQARAAHGDTAGAAAAVERARWIAGPLGMVLPDVDVDVAAPDAGPGPSSAPAPTGRRAELRRTSTDAWHVESPHGAATVADSLGIAQLARLLAAAPGREVAATELAGMDAAPVPVAHDLGAALDARAKREYRRRINELQDDIDRADADNDPERALLARLELDALVQELRRAVGLDGRDRPTGSGAERARVNVTRSLKRAVAAISEKVPDLGAHLDHSLRTGRFCSYAPEPASALTWEITP